MELLQTLDEDEMLREVTHAADEAGPCRRLGRKRRRSLGLTPETYSPVDHHAGKPDDDE